MDSLISSSVMILCGSWALVLNADLHMGSGKLHIEPSRGFSPNTCTGMEVKLQVICHQATRIGQEHNIFLPGNLFPEVLSTVPALIRLTRRQIYILTPF